MKIKWLLVVVLIISTSYLHLTMHGHDMSSHILHQELFFVPIILASFWFGLWSGLGVAAIVSLIYFLAFFDVESRSNIDLALYLQIGLYIGVAGLIGKLTNTLHEKQEKILRDEQRASLTKLVSALSFEIKDILHSLAIKHKKNSGEQNTSQELDVAFEIERMERLTDAFDKLIPKDEQPHLSIDLRDVITETKKRFLDKARKTGVTIKTEHEEDSYPSLVFNDSMTLVLDSLMNNALEVSPRGSEIVIKLNKTGAYCSIEVVDHGPGVLPEDVSKLFTPFFSTKPNGLGLGLSSGKKIMREHEGDLLFEHRVGGGAIFKMIIPRENRDLNYSTYVKEAAQ